MQYNLLLKVVYAYFTSLIAVIVCGRDNSNITISIKDELTEDSLANIYLNYSARQVPLTKGKYTLLHDNCHKANFSANSSNTSVIDGFDVKNNVLHQPTSTPGKFSWHVPALQQPDRTATADGSDQKLVERTSTSECIYLTRNNKDVIAKSNPFVIKSSHVEPGQSDSGVTIFFDAVSYYKHRTHHTSRAATRKDRKIGIIGAGISGMFSAYLLEQAGFFNYEILEATNRSGGRIITAYFDEPHLSYTEMGAMRIPYEYEYKNSTLPVNDQLILLQLIEELNDLMSNITSQQRLELIPWYIQRSSNLYYKHGFRLPDGRIPTVEEVKQNPGLVPDLGISDLEKRVKEATAPLTSPEWVELISKDVYKAYQKALNDGYDELTLWAWLHNRLGLELNATNYGTVLFPVSSLWVWMYETILFEKAKWRTIQGGMEKLVEAFPRYIRDKITYNTPVSRISVSFSNEGVKSKDTIQQRVEVGWKTFLKYDDEYSSKEYDNVIVSVPLSVVRLWHLPNDMDYTLKEAIHRLNYIDLCKVGLEFDERFWEKKYDPPIQGGCDDTDLLSSTICYPVNNIGADGPAAVLAQYDSSDNEAPFRSMTEEQHIARVLEDFTELHGDLVKKHYTGRYARKCYALDPYQAGGIALPLPGQQRSYLSSFLKMDHGMVFIGEHTNVNVGWIASSLSSAVRGVVMLLVEYGHIDEAQTIVNRYNASWIKI